MVKCAGVRRCPRRRPAAMDARTRYPQTHMLARTTLTTIRRTSLRTGVLFAVMPFAPRTAHAQELGVRAAVGVAAPIGPMGEHRSIGPALGGGLVVTPANGSWRLRLDIGTVRLQGDDPVRFSREGADLRITSATGAAEFAIVTRRTVVPYLLLGGGRHWMRVRDGQDAAESAWGLQAGFGARGPLGRATWELEIIPSATLSSFATGTSGVTVGSFMPVRVGVRF